jgi:hypothetical protein
MRTVDLAVYADALAGEAAALASRLERARRRLRQAAIEHEARRALPDETVRTLERVGLLGPPLASDSSEVEATHAVLTAVRQLQTWVEAELARDRRRAEEPASRTAA